MSDPRFVVVPAKTSWEAFTVLDTITGNTQGCYLQKDKAEEFAKRKNQEQSK